MIPESPPERTAELWAHLFEGLEGYLVTFTGQQSARTGGRPNELGAPQQRSWRWPTQQEQAAHYLLDQSQAGRDAYFGVHLFRRPSNRKAENAAEVQALWVDGDGSQVPRDWPQPTAVVESSPGRHHFYWRLTRPIDPEYAAQLNKRLCYGMGGDKGKWGLGTVLRAPGTLNYKRERPTLVEVASVSNFGRAWDPEVIDQAVPLLPEPIHDNRRGPHCEPPVELTPEALKVWRGERPKYYGTGQLDRSGSLVKIGRVLYDAGATRLAIVAALAERDEALDWCKYTARQDGDQRYHEIVDELERNGRNRRYPTQAAVAGNERDALPKIVVNNRQLPEVTAEAIEALAASNDPPEIFVRAVRLVRVREDENGVPEIQAMEDSHLKGRLARVANFVRATEKGETEVIPPDWLVKDVGTLPRWPFPALEAVVEAPIMRPDGTIFDAPGYDPRTRLYYRPVEGFDIPPIAPEPTEADTRAAISFLDEAVGEFPYEDGASAANTLALMLTPLVRQAVNGPVPLALIDKPQAGTGGSLLAETIAIIGSGRTAEMLGAPRDEEEWRKQITAKLAAGTTMITVDNVEGALYAPSLARALTARTWTDRVLGRSETVTVSQRATWIATGNNIQLRGDLPRRCYWIRLDARESRPWQRENFRHPDLLGWVTRNRGRLVHALLTLARAWFAAGKPKAQDLPRLGSFEAWAETVGGMVAFAGIPGFLGNLAALYDKADASGAEWEGFLQAWWEELDASNPITVADLTKRINDNDALKEALPGDLAEAFDKSTGSFSRKLGTALAKRAGTHYGEDGMHIVRAGEFRRAVRWKLELGSAGCEFVSLVSLINPSAGNIREEKIQGWAETNSTNSQTHTEDKDPTAYEETF